LPSQHVVLASRRAHWRCFGMSTGTFWHIDGHILTCRRALLLFYTLLVSLSSLLFGVAGHHFSMSTGTFHMSTGAFTILHFAILPVQPTFWHRGASFWHVHGHILACRRAHLPLYIPLFSLSNLLFGIAGRLFFGMYLLLCLHTDMVPRYQIG